jgi:hypothetical protein
VLIRHDLAVELRRQVVAGVATKAVLDAAASAAEDFRKSRRAKLLMPVSLCAFRALTGE